MIVIKEFDDIILVSKSIGPFFLSTLLPLSPARDGLQKFENDDHS